MINVRRLNWDPWNVAHIARHVVFPDEVEAVCHGLYVVREAHNGRLMLVGPTQVGRMLAVILEPEESGVYYPVTARPASRSERRIYQEMIESGHNDDE